jgi:hypothetical protein
MGGVLSLSLAEDSSLSTEPRTFDKVLLEERRWAEVVAPAEVLTAFADWDVGSGKKGTGAGAKISSLYGSFSSFSMSSA